jgi:hypothetical protein
MRKHVIISYLAVALASCGEQQLQKQLEQLTAKEVVITDRMRQIVAGRDSVVLNPAVGIARFVVWVDSAACSSCRVGQMFHYSKAINYHDETGGQFTPVFIFSPASDKVEGVMTILKYSEFDYPVFVDENGSFKRAVPHIPM